MVGSRKVALVASIRRCSSLLVGSVAVRLSILAVLTAIAVGSYACSLDRSTASAGPAVTLTVGIPQPGAGSSPGVGVEQVITTLTGAPLLTIGRNGRAIPGLAREWEQSADGLSWRFTLHANLTRHDGTPLTASQMAEALNDSRRDSRQRLRFPGLEDIASIEAAGPLELVVQLKRPSSLLLEALRLTPIADANADDQGAGPFRLVQDNRGEARAAGQETPEYEDVTLEAFDAYFKGPPSIDRIVLRLYPAQRTAWSALMRGEVDFLYEVPTDALEFIEAASNVRAYSFLKPYVYVVVFNLRHPVLNRLDVRLALDAAVDRQELLRLALRGRGQPATGPIYPLHWAYEPLSESVSARFEDATRLLENANLRMPPEQVDGLDARPLSRFSFECLIPVEVPRFERIARVLQRQLLAVGVDMRLVPVTIAAMSAQIQNGKFDAFFLEVNAGPGLNVPYLFWHSAPQQTAVFDTGYTRADAALDAARAARTDDELQVALHEFQRSVRIDPPGLFLVWPETARAVRTRFEFPADRDQDILSTISQWRVRSPGGDTHE